MGAYLAIDLGTTGCRGILFDEKLRLLAVGYEEYGLITPKEMWVEQDAELWWTLTLRVIRRAAAESGREPSEIRGIAVSSQGITVVPVDEGLRPLCNALSWLDVRAEAQADRLRREIGEGEMFALTGKRIAPSYTLPKLLWLRENRPEIWEKAWKLLMPMEFLQARLTGRCVTDHSMASGTLLYDIRGGCWSQELLRRYGIGEEKLPEIAWSGTPVGTVLPEIARELGLREDCVVAVGAQDQKCAALGAGLRGGAMTVSLGTAAAITRLWSSVETNAVSKVGWCGYTEPGTWVTEGVVSTAGTALRWLRDLMFPGEDYKTVNMEAKAALDRGSSLMFYPYMNGPSSPEYYPDAKGSFYGVTLATGRGDFAAAVMEGVAFQIRILLETMNACNGVERLVLFGGGAKSELWCQLIADATGMELLVPETTEAASAGAAILAARAGGTDLAALPYAKRYLPDKNSGSEERYRKYRDIEKRLWGRGRDV